jgi:hypothetical protein
VRIDDGVQTAMGNPLDKLVGMQQNAQRGENYTTIDANGKGSVHSSALPSLLPEIGKKSTAQTVTSSPM